MTVFSFARGRTRDVCPICGHFLESDHLNADGKRNRHATARRRGRKERVSREAWVDLAAAPVRTYAWLGFGTRKDIAIAELGEFVTEHAFFVHECSRRNGTRRLGARSANLKFAKNGRNK
jgi:hypothetical protein